MVVSIARHSEGFLAVRFPFDQAWLIPNGRAEGDRLLDALYNTGMFGLSDSRDASPAVFFDETPQALGRALESRHYSPRTIQIYAQWVRRFLDRHKGRALASLGEKDINAFLTHLAVDGNVSSSTQNQALAALLFLFRQILGTPVGELGEVIRAKKPIRLPVVMSRAEVRAVLSKVDGDKWLAAALLYGTGMRLMECLTLRVQDIDFGRSEILVRNGKGAKDRVTMLPETLKGKLLEHLAHVKAVHEADLSEGWGGPCLCPMPWIANIPRERPSGHGSTSSRRNDAGETPRPADKAATTWTSPSCNGQFIPPSSRPVSPNA